MKVLSILLLLIVAFAAFVVGRETQTAKPSKPPTILEDPLHHLSVAWKDIGGWVEQAAKDIKAETDKIDLTSANAWFSTTTRDVKQAVKQTDVTDLKTWLKKASEDAGFQIKLENLKGLKLEDLPQEVIKYIKENPGQTMFYVVNGVAFFSPGIVYGPLLKLLGFGARGVGAGTLAARLHSAFGGAVPAGSWFAQLTSAGMHGQGAAMLNSITRFGTLMAGAAKGVVDHVRNGTASRPDS